STDGTWELINKLFDKEERVRLYRNEKNLGIGANWNVAYQKARGEFIVIANADDIHYASFIEKALSVLNKYPDVSSVSFRYILLNNLKKTIKEISVHSNLSNGKQQNLFETCFFYNPFSIVFTVFRRTALIQLETYKGKLFLETQVCDAE